MPTFSRPLTAALLTFAGAIPAYGQTTGRLVLSDVVAEVRDHNPDINAARDREAAAKAKPAQVSAYDDPMFSYRGAHDRWHLHVVHHGAARVPGDLRYLETPASRTVAADGSTGRFVMHCGLERSTPLKPVGRGPPRRATLAVRALSQQPPLEDLSC